MNAFLLTLGIFLYFGTVGFTLLSLFPPRLRIVQGILAAPSVGVAVLILVTFYVNRAGVPVKDFGLSLATGLLVACVFTIGLLRPVFPIKKVLPYVMIAVLGMALAARPMFEFGFDWISFANDDMANYSLGAQRFYEGGYFSSPDMESFFQGRNYSDAFWFMHVFAHARSGSELLLALVWASVGKNPHQMFMPVVIALNGALLFAGAALLAGRPQRAYAAPVVAVLLAVSPMTTLGALFQLIAQVGGLALLCTSMVLICRPSVRGRVVRKTSSYVSAIIVISALCIYYPEVLPFFAAGCGVYFFLSLINADRVFSSKLLVQVLVVAGGSAVLLRGYLYDVATFMLTQARSGVAAAKTAEVLFPYFLLPSGLSAALGLAPIDGGLSEPLRSLLIGAAVLILGLFLVAIFIQLRRGASQVACMTVVMFAVAQLLFFRNNDFGLFKLVMFAQPFALGVFAVAALQRNKGGGLYSWRIGLLTVVAFVNIGVQAAYVYKSSGESAESLGDLPHASKRGIIRQFAEMKTCTPGAPFSATSLTTSSVVLGKLQALYTRGCPTQFPSRQFFDTIIFGCTYPVYVPPTLISDGILEQCLAAKSKYLKTEYFQTSDGQNSVRQIRREFRGGASVELAPGSTDIYNRYASKGPEDVMFVRTDLAKPELNFVHSELGQHYYLGRAGNISNYALEYDPMFPGREFSALGRHLLFEVQSAEKPFRVEMELTATLAKQFDSVLPDAKVQGDSLGFVGRGGGRIFSAPVAPDVRDGIGYIAVDIGRPALPMNENKSGLMQIYGRDIRIDRRLLTTFGRDISVVSDQTYQGRLPPSYLTKFPADLANKNLEYSGIYEDGWISEKSFFKLSLPTLGAKLHVTGSLPRVGSAEFSTDMVLSVDGRVVERRHIVPGAFDVVADSFDQPGIHRISIEFASTQRLPGEDGRVVGAKIDSIGFE